MYKVEKDGSEYCRTSSKRYLLELVAELYDDDVAREVKLLIEQAYRRNDVIEIRDLVITIDD